MTKYGNPFRSGALEKCWTCVGLFLYWGLNPSQANALLYFKILSFDGKIKLFLFSFLPSLQCGVSREVLRWQGYTSSSNMSRIH